MKLTGVAVGYKRYMWAPESLQVPARLLTDRCVPVLLMCVSVCFMWHFIPKKRSENTVTPAKLFANQPAEDSHLNLCISFTNTHTR